ncbi:MAG: exodeoxyribonuclease VII large subunit [Lachnospiraceae bacterium]|nr:exodeoxyribonuclease VII large subunit [Lachnospiraceae bacterium]
MQQKVYSVGQINSYIKMMFTQDFVLNRVSISGEVSNCKYHTSGHIYFSLKDETGTIACVMFASARKGLAFRLSDGMQVIADGSVGVYERDGKYQLYVSRMRQDGAGLLYERFLALKQELEDMGMFSPEYKQPIPAFVRKLGVVTAPTGAAVQDIINISRRRSPGIQIILYPAKVQGDGAAESVADGIRALDKLGLDVIIAGRGGGSIEDLWAFNEEIVARAIFECRTPVISAVGHETDTTIADFVADLRAPTPSAAAELAVTDTVAAAEQLLAHRTAMERLMRSRIAEYRMRLEQDQTRLKYASPVQRVREQRQRLIDLEESYDRAMKQLLETKKHAMALYAQKLKNVSPLEKLTQGYACVTDHAGGRVYSVGQVKAKDAIRVYVSDGVMEAEVKTAERL